MNYATKNQVKEGSLVKTDAGFTCMKNMQVKKVFKDDLGFYIECYQGKHHIETEDGKYIGLRLIKT